MKKFLLVAVLLSFGFVFAAAPTQSPNLPCYLDFNADGASTIADITAIGKFYNYKSTATCGGATCDFYDINRDGKVDGGDSIFLGAVLYKLCPYANFDYDGDGTIEYSSTYAPGSDSHAIITYLGASTSKDCGTNAACLKYDVNGDGKVEAVITDFDNLVLWRYNGKVVSTNNVIKTTPAVANVKVSACALDYDRNKLVTISDITPLSASGKFNLGYSGTSDRSCKLGGKSVRCTLFDGNSDGKITQADADILDGFINKACDLTKFDFNKNGKIEGSVSASNGVFNDGGYINNYIYATSALGIRTCSSESNKGECTSFDVDGNGKVELRDVMFLEAYEGKASGLPTPTPTVVTVNIESCSDTDNGSVPSVKGKVIQGSKVYEDYCLDSKTVIENICATSSSAAASAIQCGVRCADGRCQASPTIGDNSNVISDTPSVVATTTPVVSVNQCKDSDGGLKYYVGGVVTKGANAYADSCNNGVLREYYCSFVQNSNSNIAIASSVKYLSTFCNNGCNTAKTACKQLNAVVSTGNAVVSTGTTVGGSVSITGNAINPQGVSIGQSVFDSLYQAIAGALGYNN